MNALIPVISALGAMLGILGLGWAYLRANTAKVWQDTAVGYKERTLLLEEELRRANERVAILEAKVDELQKRPDMTHVMEEFVRQQRTLERLEHLLALERAKAGPADSSA